MGREIVRQIQNRTTEQGTDRFGEPFIEYSSDYADKKGVSPNDVDLLLTGSMLGSMIVKEATTRSVTIGFRGQKNNNKAHGHDTGGGNLPQRSFLGLTDSDKASLKSRFGTGEENGG